MSASPERFRVDPASAWGFYGHRLQLYGETLPHPGFDILKRWGEDKPDGYFVFTSNVDGQFQKAGFDPTFIAQCHGSIHTLQCLNGCSGRVWSADEVKPEIDLARCLMPSALPRCHRCGALARPNLLMFNDDHWIGDRYELGVAELWHWLKAVKRLVVVEAGAGTAIATVRSFGDRSAGTLIRINVREPRVVWPKDVSMQAGALEALRALDLELAR